MPVAEQPQHMRALARANELRNGRAKERRELREASAEEIEAALLNPSDALATYTLSGLLAPAERTGLIKRFRKTRLNRLLWDLTVWNPKGRKWDGAVRLGALTPMERRKLVDALRPYLPKKRPAQ